MRVRRRPRQGGRAGARRRKDAGVRRLELFLFRDLVEAREEVLVEGAAGLRLAFELAQRDFLARLLERLCLQLPHLRLQALKLFLLRFPCRARRRDDPRRLGVDALADILELRLDFPQGRMGLGNRRGQGGAPAREFHLAVAEVADQLGLAKLRDRAEVAAFAHAASRRS
jgi:hypothetical protein